MKEKNKKMQSVEERPKKANIFTVFVQKFLLLGLGMVLSQNLIIYLFFPMFIFPFAVLGQLLDSDKSHDL